MQSIHGVALGLALVLNAAANILMKIGMTKVHDAGGLFSKGVAGAVGTIVSAPALIIGLTCFALNAGFYMFALQSKALKISVAYPLMVGGGYAIIATVGYFALGEQLNAVQKVGVAFILGGVIVVASQTGAAA